MFSNHLFLIFLKSFSLTLSVVPQTTIHTINNPSTGSPAVGALSLSTIMDRSTISYSTISPTNDSPISRPLTNSELVEHYNAAQKGPNAKPKSLQDHVRKEEGLKENIIITAATTSTSGSHETTTTTAPPPPLSTAAVSNAKKDTCHFLFINTCKKYFLLKYFPLS